MSKPTPGPWIATDNEVRQPAGRMIAYTGPHHTPESEYPLSCKLEDAANAAHIVKCVNAHNDLLREMRRFLPVLERIQQDHPRAWAEATAGTGIATANAYRHAIAKATGERQ